MKTTYLCNLVIPGAAKSGTSSLHEALDRHPQICMSSRKEPHHFDRLSRFSRGPAVHNDLFDQSSGACLYGESSTGYMISEEAIARIRDSLAAPRIIMVLRDPVERTFSHYRWRYRLGLERRPLLRAVKEDGYGFDPENPTEFGFMSYLQYSKYSVYVPLWIETFGRENILFLASGRLKADMGEVLGLCCRFLGVAPYRETPRIEANRTGDLVVRPGRVLRRLEKVLPKRFRKGQRYLASRDFLLRFLTREPPAVMRPEERRFLEQELADDLTFFRDLFPS